jgi:hypothetical protein
LLIQIILALSILFSSQDIDEELPTPGSPSSGSHHSDSEKDPREKTPYKRGQG